ncbi:MAG: ASCH domain-containing protein [Lachnospiraceae bacterium]|nr:ASCH domain-containing protein [Muribaculaceae bacterium]MCM1411073.1 ASCH domain-containing protein [Lachnospiraceae bacterium]
MKRVITLQEPWASLIGEGIKTIETRSWPCTQFGELYIHAGMTKIPTNDLRIKQLSNMLSGPFHYGSIFVKCTLSDCILIDEQFARTIKEGDYNNFLCGDYTPGRYAWILKDITPILPIPAKGKLGIWYYQDTASC